MKELKIELNKSGRLKNKYDSVIKIGRTPKGCFIVTEEIKAGPFERIFITLLGPYRHKTGGISCLDCQCSSGHR